MGSWTVKELLKVSADYLKARGVESPRLTAETLLAHQMSSDRISLYLHFDSPVGEQDLAGYRDLISRRARGEPLQYLTGKREFWSLDFMVDKRVLIPRPETEVLVEQTLIAARQIPSHIKPFILDIGTGSGVLAVCIARELPRALVYATDISSGALAVAQENASRHGVAERVKFLRGDLFSALKGMDTTFDIIVSNPPYVSAEDWADLPAEIKYYEPREALYGGPGGTVFLERIIEGAWGRLVAGGMLLLEASPGQTARLLEILEQTGHYEDMRRVMDYSGRYRVVMARAKNKLRPL